MNILNILVVGNKFLISEHNKVVIKISDLIHFIYFSQKESDQKHLPPKNKILIHIGQGVSKKNIHILRTLASYQKFNCTIVSSIESTEYCEKQYVHKHEQKNVMITTPKKLDPTSYESYFLLDDECAEMSDHVTGNHIQGVIINEAARQMTLAVSEKFLLTKNKKNRMSFVTNSVKSDYTHYLFPSQIRIKMILKSIRYGYNENFIAQAQILFFQNNQQCAEINSNFSCMNKDYIYEKETKLANQTIFQQIG